METFLFEGLFYEESGSLWVASNLGRQSVENTLICLDGRNVKIFMHHLYDQTLSDRWGMGSCMWQPSECPYGHHKDPRKLLYFESTGIFDYKNRTLHTSNGVCNVPLGYLNGHRSRLLFLGMSGGVVDLDSSETKTEDLIATLNHLKQALGEF